MIRSIYKLAAIVAALVLSISSVQAADITLHGASQFDENHAFPRLMRR